MVTGDITFYFYIREMRNSMAFLHFFYCKEIHSFFLQEAVKIFRKKNRRINFETIKMSQILSLQINLNSRLSNLRYD